MPPCSWPVPPCCFEAGYGPVRIFEFGNLMSYIIDTGSDSFTILGLHLQISTYN